MSRLHKDKSPGLADLLAAEAADMEHKLLALRKAMEAERAKREGIIGANPNGGSVWKNGGGGLLRSNFRAKQGAPAGKGGGAPGGSPAAKASPPAKQPQAQQQQAPAMSVDGRSGTPPAKEAAQPPRAVSMQGVAVAPQAPRLAAFQPKRESERLTVHTDDAPVASGMACGADDNDALANGAFNEADSHRSFLEALNEWRKGNKGDAGAGEEGGSGRDGVRASSSTGQERPGAVMEVQTEAGPSSRQGQRPQSARTSYFNKFLISTAARQAGEAAGDGSSRPSSARPASASPTMASMSARPTSALRESSGAPRPPPGPAATAGAGAASSSSLGGVAEPLRASGDMPLAAGAPDPKLSILDRLEQLELQHDQDDDDDEDEDGGRLVEVSTAAGLGLTKGVRLPDNIVVPDDHAD